MLAASRVRGAMFSVREGLTQFQSFQEWFSLIQAAEEMDLDTVWLGKSNFRPQRAVLASSLVAALVVAGRTMRTALAWRLFTAAGAREAGWPPDQVGGAASVRAALAARGLEPG